MKKAFHFKWPGIAIPFLALIISGCDISLPSLTYSTSMPSSSLVISESSLSSTIVSSMSSSTATSSAQSLSPSSSSSQSSVASSTSSTTSSSESQSTSNQPVYQGYYQAINGVSDVQLKPTLTSILRSVLTSSGLLPSSITYGNARYDIPLYDQDPSNPNQVILVYSRASVSSTWDAGSTWNREHVFPQSLLGVSTENSSRHKGADYHNLKPENPSVNSSRGNKYFAETTTSVSYAPPNVVRGDVARILFYMVTMWPELSLVDVTGSNSPSTFQMAQLTFLVKWHLDDPVDSFEQRRNDVIYGLQGNRNPFVDHEELVCKIWGSSNPNTQVYCAA
jgi:endonuclease I